MLSTVLAAGIILLVVLLDQISKLLTLGLLYEDKVVVIKGILNFTYVENRGMAFGLLANHRWGKSVNEKPPAGGYDFIGSCGESTLPFYCFSTQANEG